MVPLSGNLLIAGAYLAREGERAAGARPDSCSFEGRGEGRLLSAFYSGVSAFIRFSAPGLGSLLAAFALTPRSSCARCFCLRSLPVLLPECIHLCFVKDGLPQLGEQDSVLQHNRHGSVV